MRRTTLALAVLIPLLTRARASRADGLIARDTADVGHRGAYSVGVFGPATYAPRDGIEIQAHPVLFLVSPNATVRVSHLRRERWRATGEYGLSIPTLAMRLTQGTLFPAWERGGGRIGWYVAPRAGVVVSAGQHSAAVLTLLADLTIGIPLTHSDATPLGAPAPLELLFAPVLSGYRSRVGAAYDARLGARWRARGYGDVYLHGREKGFAPPDSFSNLTFRLGLGIDVGVGRTSRFTLGAAWWNSDQHAIDPVTLERKRSNDVLPTIDFVWSG